MVPTSTIWPAYMTAMRSAMERSTGRSWVTKMMPPISPRASSSRSNSISTRWVDTSSAEVGSSAISSAGLSSVDSTVTTRCFMPPESWCG